MGARAGMSKPLSISQLIAAVGDDNIQVQGIHQNHVSANVKGHNGNITFATAPDKVMDLLQGNDSEWIGLVVWMPRKLVPL